MSTTPDAVEMNFDGLVGPTHHYGGLAHGNLASMANRCARANPRAAVLEGLAKMRRLMDLGVPQAVLPPQPRPALWALRQLGFSGDDAAVVERTHREAPELLSACYSASSMWAANAATVSPSADTRDGRVHLTPANLISGFHRSLEAGQTHRVLSAIFADPEHFAVHPPLPHARPFADEGAANHCRFADTHGAPGVEMFVHGASPRSGQRFLPRQARGAQEAVVRRHGLRADAAVFVQQSPGAIDAGVFHNDVIAVAHRGVLLYHERAFADGDAALARVDEARASLGAPPVRRVIVQHDAMSVDEAVDSYLFNSQLVDLPDGRLRLLCPVQCSESLRVREVVDHLVAGDSPIDEADFVELRQSMRNGGGPACLRLRVVLTAQERAAMHRGVVLDDAKHAALVRWADKHYRDRLDAEDLRDPALIDESRAALDEVSALLGLGSLYSFQRDGGG